MTNTILNFLAKHFGEKCPFLVYSFFNGIQSCIVSIYTIPRDYFRKRYFKYTNKTQANALAYLERCTDDGKSFKCPHCTYSTRNGQMFNDHISEEHGYPKDMEIFEYIHDDKIIPCSTVEKANPEYLKYL